MDLVFKEVYELNTILQYPLNNDILISYSKTLLETIPNLDAKMLRFVIYLFKFGVLTFDKGKCITDIINALKYTKELKEWLKAFNIQNLTLQQSIKLYQDLFQLRQIIYHNDTERNYKIQNYNINEYFKRIANKITTASN